MVQKLGKQPEKRRGAEYSPQCALLNLKKNTAVEWNIVISSPAKHFPDTKQELEFPRGNFSIEMPGWIVFTFESACEYFQIDLPMYDSPFKH